jgi:hypothetical protein
VDHEKILIDSNLPVISLKSAGNFTLIHSNVAGKRRDGLHQNLGCRYVSVGNPDSLFESLIVCMETMTAFTGTLTVSMETVIVKMGNLTVSMET